MNRDIKTIIEPVVAVHLISVVANGNTVGAIIDTQGYEAIDFVIRADNTVASGTITPLVEAGNLPALGDSAPVSDDDLIGTEALSALTADGVSHLGCVTKKRYVRLTLVGSANPTADVSAIAILGFPHTAPTA